MPQTAEEIKTRIRDLGYNLSHVARLYGCTYRMVSAVVHGDRTSRPLMAFIQSLTPHARSPANDTRRSPDTQ